jgi:hypothetical protein
LFGLAVPSESTKLIQGDTKETDSYEAAHPSSYITKLKAHLEILPGHSVSNQHDLRLPTTRHTHALIRQIIGAVSQYERTMIRGRMMVGKAAKKAAGD